MQLALESDLDAGHLAFSNLGLQHLTASDVIRRSTYSVGGQATAVKVQGDPDATKNGIFFLYSDHLGSTSVMSYGYNLNGSLHPQAGQVVAGSEARYLPFGGWRGTTPTAGLTDRGYTGHKSNNLGSNNLGLIYMNARFYAPGVSRFVTADIVIPNPADPQAYNRYTYVRNDPVNLIDPTGHFTQNAIETYLQVIYGDEWEDVLERWQNDAAWWELIRFAQAGDVLLGSTEGTAFSSTRFAATFVGIGDSVLTGIYHSDPSRNKIGNGQMPHNMSLEDIRIGTHVWPAENTPWTNIDGFIRWSGDGKHITHVYGGHHGYTTQIAPSGLLGTIVRKGIDIAFSVGVGATLESTVGWAAPAIPLLARIPKGATALVGGFGSETVETILGGGLSDRWITVNGLGENQVKINFHNTFLVVDHQESQDTIVYWGP